MSFNEIARLKVAAAEVIAAMQGLNRQRAALDIRAAEHFRKAKASGLDRRAIKEIIRDLRGDPADAETIWRQYLAKVGIDENALAATDDDVGSVDILAPIII